MRELKITVKNGDLLTFPVSYKVQLSDTVSGLCKYIKYNKYTTNLMGWVVVDTESRKYTYCPELVLKNKGFVATRIEKDYAFNWGGVNDGIKSGSYHD